MATPDDHRLFESDNPLAGLVDGQRLDQPTFHQRYSRMPEDFRAELIEGVVHAMSSPVKPGHGRPFNRMNWFLYTYVMETPGTIAQGDTTAKLSPQDEVQPDCALLIDPLNGGRTSEDLQTFTLGCPELVVEISSSTLSMDLNAKKRVYEAAGALEYLVHDVLHQKFHWFALRDGKFEPLKADVDGIYRSAAFPGLWLDAAAFLRGDGLSLMAILRLGLASDEHARFVDQLDQNRANRP